MCNWLMLEQTQMAFKHLIYETELIHATEWGANLICTQVLLSKDLSSVPADG